MNVFRNGLCWWILGRLTVYLLLVAANASAQIADFSREYCRAYLPPCPAALSHLDGYKTLDKHHLRKAIINVPPQAKYESVREWSCSQNSVARAIILQTGAPLHRSEKDYLSYAHTIPKAVGSYGDHRFDKRFLYSSYGVDLLQRWLVSLGVAKRFQGLAYVNGINFGLSPQWLKDYMNFYRYDLGRENLSFNTFLSDDYEKVIEKIQASILKQHAVIAMVVYSLQRWHYLNIVGFNETSVVVLDTDARLYIWSNDLLKCFMNTGFHSSYTDMDEYFTAAVSTVVNQITPLNYYNLLIVSQMGLQKDVSAPMLAF